VCELGSQDFVPKEYNNWMARVPEKTARGLYQHLGASSYTCIDVNGEQGALRIDLNTSVWTGELFDVVTNHGTSEHVFNQFNCFRFMHDLTKLGGLMVHVVPGQGYYRHGFFNYGGLVFEALEKANNYGRICCYEEDDRQGSLMVVVFRKMADVRFVIPVQTTYGATVPECR
jgi:hypothetical protein